MESMAIFAKEKLNIIFINTMMTYLICNNKGATACDDFEYFIFESGLNSGNYEKGKDWIINHSHSSGSLML